MISRRAFACALPFVTVSVRRLRAADVDGKWQAEVPGPGGSMTMLFDLRADGEALTGTVGNEMMGESQIEDGMVSGASVSFVQVITRGQRQIRFKYEGKLAGDELELTRSMQRPAGMGPGGGGRGPGAGGGNGGPGGQGGDRPQRQGGGQGGNRPPGGGRGGMGAPVTFTAKRVQ